MAEKKKPLSESYNYLKKSLDNLTNQQSSGPPPELYPTSNGPSLTPQGSGQNNPDSNNGNSQDTSD